MTSITSQIHLELALSWNLAAPTNGSMMTFPPQEAHRMLVVGTSKHRAVSWGQVPLDPPIVMTSGVQGWTSVLMWTDVSKVLVLQRVRHGMAPQHYLGTNLLAFLCIEFSSLEL
jgi:hypothetical protein